MKTSPQIRLTNVHAISSFNAVHHSCFIFLSSSPLWPIAPAFLTTYHPNSINHLHPPHLSLLSCHLLSPLLSALKKRKVVFYELKTVKWAIDSNLSILWTHVVNGCNRVCFHCFCDCSGSPFYIRMTYLSMIALKCVYKRCCKYINRCYNMMGGFDSWCNVLVILIHTSCTRLEFIQINFIWQRDKKCLFALSTNSPPCWQILFAPAPCTNMWFE